MADKKIYLGRGQYKFGDTDFFYSINMTKLKDEAAWLKENGYLKESKGSSYLNFKITPLREGKDNYGNTHKVEVDLWKPDASKKTEQPVLIDQGRDADELNDDIPF